MGNLFKLINMPAIEIKNLTKTYATGTQALKGVDLTVQKGDFFALLGANGAGKTTIINILTGLTNKSSGTVKIYGYDLDKERETDLAKMEIGLVPQEFNFNIFETVLDVVVTQGGYFGIPRRDCLLRAHTILQALGLWEKRHEVTMRLSGGMKRRLMIARALIHQPKLLFLDEPTAGVDVELRHDMWSYLRDLNQNGVTILLTTHYLEEAEELCRKVAIIHDGLVVQQGATSKLLGEIGQQTYVISLKMMKERSLGVSRFELKEIDENIYEAELNLEQDLQALIEDLARSQAVIRDIRPKSNRLEQLFLKIVGGSKS